MSTFIINNKSRIKQQTINFIVFAMCISVTLLGFGGVKLLDITSSKLSTTIEQTWREQSRRTLSSLKDEFIADVSNGVINPADNISVQNWAKIHINGIRNGGKTSDGFMIKMPNLEMEWDGSSDCLITSSPTALRRLNEYGSLFKQPATLDNTVQEMKKYYSTKAGDNNYWVFDDSPELLEWIILPSDSLGFNKEPLTQGGVLNDQYISYLIQLGTQKDEIYSPYKDVFNNFSRIQHNIQILLAFTMIISFFNLIAYVFISKKRLG